jgi:hypothetical protein
VEFKLPNNQPKSMNRNIVTGFAFAVLAVIGVSMSQSVVRAAAAHTVKVELVIIEQF